MPPPDNKPNILICSYNQPDDRDHFYTANFVQHIIVRANYTHGPTGTLR